MARLFRLATLAAVTPLALAVPGTASTDAIVLCKESKEPCPRPYSGSVVALAEEVKFQTNIVDVSCNHAEVEGTAPATEANPLPIAVSGLSFSACSDEVVVTDQTGGLDLEKVASNRATIESDGFAS